MNRPPDPLAGFATLVLPSWAALRELQREGWIYRGHSDARILLEATFDRCCLRHDVHPGRRERVEAELLREFRRAYHQYARHLPPSEALLEWLSLMQHHGAPTRLLDFTYSVYIAAYFALECAVGDAAIWAVNLGWALEESRRRFRAAGKPEPLVRALELPNTEATEGAVNQLLASVPWARTVWPVNPFRLNDRLRLQKGVFLAPGDISAPFMANLVAMEGHQHPDNLVRIIIPAREIRPGLVDLFQMNLTRRSLFPGLDGYASELAIYHPVFNPETPLAQR